MGKLAPDSTNCIAYYKLEDNTDSVASLDLTVTGATSGVTGKVNNAYDFDGINDFLTTGTYTPSWSVFSISMWVYVENLSSAPITISKDNASKRDFYIAFQPTGYVRARVNDKSPNTFDSATGLVSDNNWYHVVLVVNTTSVQVYLNNSKVIDESCSGALSWTDQAIELGRFGANSNYLEGIIDETALFDVALTADNVNFLYNDGSPGALQQYPMPNAPDSANCAAYYTFDSDATDSTSNGYDGTVQGATNTTGKLNNGYDFDGVNDYIDFGDQADFDVTSANTVSFFTWINVDDLSTQRAVAGKWKTSTTQARNWLFRVETDGDLGFFTGNGSGSTSSSTISTSTPISVDTWYHVGFVWNAGTLTIYVNGSSVATANSLTSTASVAKMAVGAEDGTGGAGSAGLMDGTIDEVAVFTTSLTEGEVAFLYQNGTPTSTQQYPMPEAPDSADCVAYYKFESDASDELGTYDGTVNGNSFSAGVVDNGMVSDGVNDITTIPQITEINSGDFSISFWFNPSVTTGMYALSMRNGVNFRIFVEASSNTVTFDRVTPSGTDRSTTVSELNLGTWYHFVFVFTSVTGNVEFYYNSVSQFDENTGAMADNGNTNDVLSIAATSYNAEIDELAIFDAAIDLNSVAYLYNAGSPTSEQQYDFSAAPAGWSLKILGVTSPAKVNGIAVANISKVNGVS